MPRKSLALSMVAGLVLAACGDGDTSGPADAARPTIAVTTGILGDVVAELVGDHAEVTVVMPAGTDPHDFQPSARQVAAIRDADAIVVNGAGLEEGLLDTIGAATAAGVPTFEAIGAVDVLPLPGGEPDPHFFGDPARMAAAATALAAWLVTTVPDLDTAAFRDGAAAAVADLEALDAEVAETLAAIPADHRVLVTNHAVLGYLADRYGFEVTGVVVPGGSTGAEPSAADLAALAGQIRDLGVPAVFTDTSASRRLVDAVAAEAGDVAVVELHTEALGPTGSGAETYAGLMRSNAALIADALA